MHFKCSLLPSAPSRKAAWLPTLATNMKHLHLTCGLHIWPFFPISVHLSQHNRSGYQKLFFACFSWLRNISKSSTTSLLCLFLLLNAVSISIMPSHFALIRCFQETSFLLPSACLLTSLFIYWFASLPSTSCVWVALDKDATFSHSIEIDIVFLKLLKSGGGLAPKYPQALWRGKLHLFSYSAKPNTLSVCLLIYIPKKDKL